MESKEAGLRIGAGATATATACGVCAALLVLSGCGGAQGGREPEAPGKTGAVSSPAQSRPVPRGDGSDVGSDLNGDGHPDLVLGEDLHAGTRLSVAYGSEKGLDPSTHTVIGPGGLQLGETGQAADLDGDGYSDIPVAAAPGQAMNALATPHIVWGGPKGPQSGRTPVKVPLPEGFEAGYEELSPTTGDFNGDGHPDLALNGPNVAVLYGPFSRDGRPDEKAVPQARTDIEGGASIVADPAASAARDSPGGKRATGLVVLGRGGDGEQVPATYIPGGPGGLREDEYPLSAGNAAAFGDFNGDGRRDIAVADSGSRNNEAPGSGSAARPDAVAVHYGTEGGGVDGKEKRLTSPAGTGGVGGRVLAVDTDGDGADELAALGYPATEGETQADKVLVFDGGRQGLRPDGARTLRRLSPAKTAGRELPAGERLASPEAARDLDGDGREELLLSFAGPGYEGSQVWVTDGHDDQQAFSTAKCSQEKQCQREVYDYKMSDVEAGFK
ncbi:FG-GAP repeat domain-containing protein [Streptomyces monticola]|uniref:FG-GAP repeat domain-containing protein n=1 Tax=Streptomyces monticola TaxID=2666263 RepID=A0ABW2JLX7_9ACTN